MEAGFFIGKNASIMGGLAAKMKNIDGKLLGKDSKPMKDYRNSVVMKYNQATNVVAICVNSSDYGVISVTNEGTTTVSITNAHMKPIQAALVNETVLVADSNNSINKPASNVELGLGFDGTNKREVHNADGINDGSGLIQYLWKLATKAIWKLLEIIYDYEGNNQVKNNKIDLLVQQYEQFVISEDETIDSAFPRLNTIITSLKALDEGYFSKNYVRKFLRDLHPKWRAKVTMIEESKDLTSLSLDELIENLKVHEMIIKKDSKIVKAKGERKSLALKAKKESSDEECSTSGSEDEEYAMAVRDFKNSLREEVDFGEEDDEKVKDEMYVVAQASSEVCYESSYFSDENSSIDDLVLDDEYDKLCKVSLKIITKNKRLKATRNSLEKELSILKEKVSTLEKNKGVDLKCVKCHMLKVENEKLKEEAIRLNKFEKITHCQNEMLSNQNPVKN
ncbi:hypothetical protein Tco_1218079 [Tanacetum coccineum]